MDTLDDCSFNEDHYEMDDTICEGKASTVVSPPFETLTAGDITTLMNEYIENVQTILGVNLFWSSLFNTKIAMIQKIIFNLYLFCVHL